MSQPFGIEVLASDVTDSAGAYSFVEITEFAFPALAGQFYELDYSLFVTTAATTTSAEFDVNASPSTAATLMAGIVEIPVSATESSDAIWQVAINGYADVATSPATLAATAGNLVRMRIHVQPSVAQIITPRFATEIDMSAVVVEAGLSRFMWRRLA